jgi:hypothetical protein
MNIATDEHRAYIAAARCSVALHDPNDRIPPHRHLIFMRYQSFSWWSRHRTDHLIAFDKRTAGQPDAWEVTLMGDPLSLLVEQSSDYVPR